MRVIQISQDLHDGGAARCVRELLNGLSLHGVNVRALVADASATPHPDAVAYRHSWERFLSLLELFPGSTDWRHRGCVQMLSRINRRVADVVHLHVLQNGAASIRAVAELCRRVPAVWTLHDEWAFTGGLTSDLRGLVDPKEIVAHASGFRRLLAYSPYHDSFRFRDTQRMLKHWMPQPRIVVAPSYAYAAKARSSGRFPNSEIRVVRNGISLAGFPDCSLPRQEARSRLSLPNRPTVLLLAATLKLPVKGIRYGIAALNRMNPVPHVLLVGHSSHEVRDSIRGEVTCLPRQKDHALVSAYRAADVTLVPSLAESFSLVAGESMACGTPVVGFSVGGLAELIGDNERGLAAKPYDIEGLSQCLTQLLTNPRLCTTLGESGRRWIHAECSMESHLRSIAALYRDVIIHDDNKSR